MTSLFALACNVQEENPFFSSYGTPFETAPFSKIKIEHYIPAFTSGTEKKISEVELIANNTQAPDFKNTLVALDNSGQLLNKVSDVFYNLTSAHTNDELQAISKKVAPLLSQMRDDIRMNEKLFKRIKSVYDQKETLNLNTEQNRLLEKYYIDFVRGGANLNVQDKEKLRAINKKLSLLSISFGENILKENNGFELAITDKSDLSGLPEASVKAAEEGHPGKWIFTLHKPSLIPFLQYSDKRVLREKMFKGYINRGDNQNTLDNNKILAEMANLRLEKAQLLGYENHAAFVLDKNMAKTPQAVYDLLNQLWTPALERAKREVKDMQKLISKEGNDFKLQPWDWWYYTEKLRKAKYDFDSEELRPYFELENVRNGAFAVANKLFDITFTERKDIPVYHPEVRVFEVKEADGTHIGILYVDYHPRASKRGGAWMNAYRKQVRIDGKQVTPVICNVCNFSKPTGDKPALLSFEEVQTLFHEFGHALHGLLSNCTYYGLSGTSVARDFVELPSQIMENWAAEPQVLKTFAKHYQTGAPIPDALIEKMEKTGHFNQGFKTVEYLAASFLDMDWHTITKPVKQSPLEFENNSMAKIGLISEIVPRYRSSYFSHIFSGGYSSGYYSYIWAEVLDADAFQAFTENGIYDKPTATALRENILSAGGTDNEMKMYKKFRGREPKIEALMERKGLN